MPSVLAKTALSALKRQARPGMVLRPDARGGFCVSGSTDARRRTAARVSALEAKTMASEGLIETCGEERFQIASAGRQFLKRTAADTEAQNAPPADYVPQSAALRRLRALAGAHRRGGGGFSGGCVLVGARGRRGGAPPPMAAALGQGGAEADPGRRERCECQRASLGGRGGFLADAVDHRGQTVGALRRQSLAKLQTR